MTIRLHLRRLRVVEVLEDAIEELVVAVSDVRTVVRCPFCGFLTSKVHDRRRVRVRDLPHGGRPTVLVWVRRRFSCRRGHLPVRVASGEHGLQEFWAWVPTMESVARWFDLGADAADLYARYWDVDLQMLQSLVDPWPREWPSRLFDLNAAAAEAGAEIPARTPDHLNPRVHALWNRRLFEMIAQARQG